MKIKIFPFSLFKISGTSMQPFLNPGDRVLTFNWIKNFKKGEIIVFRHQALIKIKRISKIENDQLFVQGDNQSQSTDSRLWGKINKSQIIGKVIILI